MIPKKKRAVNPDIPRPNLLSHEKTIRETRVELAEAIQEIARLNAKIDELDRRVRFQDQQISQFSRQNFRRF